MVLLIGLLVQSLIIVEVNGLNKCLEKKRISNNTELNTCTLHSCIPDLSCDCDDLKLSVEQYLHNMRMPGLDPQEGRGHLGGACVQVARVLIDHLSGLPAGPVAKPGSHTMTPEEGKKENAVLLQFYCT